MEGRDLAGANGRRRGVASAIAIGIAIVLAAAPVRAAPEGEPVAAAAGKSVIAVEMAASVERGDALAEKMLQEGARLLQAHRIAAEVDEKDPKRMWIRVDGTDYDWSVVVSVERDGEVIKALEPAKCECTKEELIDRAMQGVVDLLPVLRGEESAPPPKPANGTGNGDGTKPPERKRLGGAGKAGVALIVVGAGGAIAGAVLLGIGQKQEAGSNPAMQEVVDYRAPGGAVLGVGLAALIVGAVLLGVDRSRARKRTAFVPVLSPRWVGVRMETRF